MSKLITKLEDSRIIFINENEKTDAICSKCYKATMLSIKAY